MYPDPFDPYLIAFMVIGAAAMTGFAVWAVWLVSAVAALVRAACARLRPAARAEEPARGWFAPHTHPGGEGR